MIRDGDLKEIIKCNEEIFEEDYNSQIVFMLYEHNKREESFYFHMLELLNMKGYESNDISCWSEQEIKECQDITMV